MRVRRPWEAIPGRYQAVIQRHIDRWCRKQGPIRPLQPSAEQLRWLHEASSGCIWLRRPHFLPQWPWL